MKFVSPFCLFLYLLSFCGGVGAEDTGIDNRLRDAAADLALAEGVLARMESSFQEMQANPDTPPEQVLAMEQYVQELKVMVKIRRDTLEDLELISGKSVPEMDVEVAEGMKAFDEAIEQIPGTEAPETEEERLNREFQESLENFDGMILAYNEKLEAQMDARISIGAEATGKQKSAVDEAEALLQSMGVETGESTEGGTQETAGTEQGGQKDVDRTPSENGTGSQGTRPGAGENRPAPEDEDIVARQLREAAENETDPVLREKLWKEYEAYLDGPS